MFTERPPLLQPQHQGHEGGRPLPPGTINIITRPKGDVWGCQGKDIRNTYLQYV